MTNTKVSGAKQSEHGVSVELVENTGPAQVAVFTWGGERVHALVEKGAPLKVGDTVFPHVESGPMVRSSYHADGQHAMVRALRSKPREPDGDELRSSESAPGPRDPLRVPQ